MKVKTDEIHQMLSTIILEPLTSSLYLKTITIKLALNSERVRNLVFSASGNNTARGCAENLKF
jgi:hypothetical protein